MRKSVAASLGLHAAILVAALVVLPSPNVDMKPQEAIQVDITNIGAVNKVMATSKDGEKTEKPAQKKTETLVKTDPAEKVDKKVQKAVKEAAADPTPPPKPEPKPEPPKPEPPKPEPKPEPPKPQPKPEPPKPEPPPPDPNALNNLIKDTIKEEPKKEPPKEQPKKPDVKPAEQKTAAAPVKKGEKKVATLNTDEVAAMLNKLDASAAPDSASATDGKPAKGAKTFKGNDDQMSATILSAMVSKLKDCWDVPPGAREGNVIVQVHFMLNKDGSVAGMPEVMNGSADPLFDLTARSAVAAVMNCQNYDFLPKDRYDLWKDNEINFNPNMMFTN